MELRYPILIVIFGLIGLVFSLLLRRLFRERHKVYFLSNINFIKIASRSRSGLILKKILKIIKNTLLVLTIFLLLLLTARPQVSQVIRNEQSGIDIMVVLDVSGSMEATDVRPTRLEASKRVIKSFVQNLETDRIGLVLFTISATTLCPLTDDYTIVEEYVDKIQFLNIYSMFDFDVEKGTASVIGDGVVLASQKFQQNARSKVIILLTDGEAKGGVDPIKSAEFAKGKGVKIYPIFVGSDYSNTGSKTLEEMAKISNGKYYTAEDQDTIKRIFSDVQSLEKVAIETTTNKIIKDDPNILFTLSTFTFILYLMSKITLERWN